MKNIEIIKNQEPEELLKNYANFRHYQLLGQTLDYNPVIPITGLPSMTLAEWDYFDLNDGEKRALDIWAGKARAREFHNLIINASSKSFATEKTTYRSALGEIEEKLRISKPFASDSSKTYFEIEQNISKAVISKFFEKLDALSIQERKKLNEDMTNYLLKNEPELARQAGGTPITEILKQGGGALLCSVAGTYMITGIILSNLGVWSSLLFTVGLYSIPGFLIGGSIFAPIAAGLFIYNMGQHNFKKTIPTVSIINMIRIEAIDAISKAQPEGNKNETE